MVHNIEHVVEENNEDGEDGVNPDDILIIQQTVTEHDNDFDDILYPEQSVNHTDPEDVLSQHEHVIPAFGIVVFNLFVL